MEIFLRNEKKCLWYWLNELQLRLSCNLRKKILFMISIFCGYQFNCSNTVLSEGDCDKKVVLFFVFASSLQLTPFEKRQKETEAERSTETERQRETF